MICLDTGPVIWGVQRLAAPGQEELVERTRRYIRHLEEMGQRIIVPAPVLGEYLMGFDTAKEREAQSAILERHFLVPSLDARAAALAASLEKEAAPENRPVDRQRFRVDAQIIAIAIVTGADIVVSHDAHMAALAGERIRVQEVPSIPEQLKLA